MKLEKNTVTIVLSFITFIVLLFLSYYYFFFDDYN